MPRPTVVYGSMLDDVLALLAEHAEQGRRGAGCSDAMADACAGAWRLGGGLAEDGMPAAKVLEHVRDELVDASTDPAELISVMTSMYDVMGVM